MKNSESRRNSYCLSRPISMWSRRHGRRLFLKLQATVAIISVLSAYVPVPAMAQQPAQGGAATPPAAGLPPAPQPNYTEPLFMRPSDKDFTKPHQVFPNYLKTWEPITVAGAGNDQFPASGCAGSQREDLLEPGRRDRSRPREQLRYRHTTL